MSCSSLFCVGPCSLPVVLHARSCSGELLDHTGICEPVCRDGYTLLGSDVLMCSELLVSGSFECVGCGALPPVLGDTRGTFSCSLPIPLDGTCELVCPDLLFAVETPRYLLPADADEHYASTLATCVGPEQWTQPLCALFRVEEGSCKHVTSECVSSPDDSAPGQECLLQPLRPLRLELSEGLSWNEIDMSIAHNYGSASETMSSPEAGPLILTVEDQLQWRASGPEPRSWRVCGTALVCGKPALSTEVHESCPEVMNLFDTCQFTCKPPFVGGGEYSCVLDTRKNSLEAVSEKSGNCACPQGSDEVNGFCVCPLGHFVSEGGCEACPAGTFLSIGDLGATACTLCPLGRFSDRVAQSDPGTCEPCAANASVRVGSANRGDCVVPLHEDVLYYNADESGLHLIVELDGQHLHSTGHVAQIMETCGGQPILSQQTTESNTHFAETFSDGSTTTRTTIDSAIAHALGGAYDFGVLGVAGGAYELCWCGGSEVSGVPCSQSEHFTYKAGDLIIFGPYGNQAFTCAKGPYCLLSRIRGFGLEAGDAIAFSSACGEGRLLPPLTSAEEQFARSHGQNGSKVEFVNVLAQVTPGSYALCWCRGESCNLALARTQVGKLVLHGPYRAHERACSRGQACSLEGINGVQLESGDKVMVLNGCGTGSKVPGMPLGGVAVSTFTDASGAYANYAFSNSTVPCGEGVSPCRAVWRDFVDAYAGIYRLCWCRARSLNLVDFAGPHGSCDKLRFLGASRFVSMSLS